MSAAPCILHQGLIHNLDEFAIAFGRGEAWHGLQG
jgi:hypothetical protein